MAYQDTYNQFRQANPPDPNTFLKMLWPNLDPHQQSLFTELLRRPVASNTSQGLISAAGSPAASSPAPTTNVAAVEQPAPPPAPKVPTPAAPRGTVTPIVDKPAPTPAAAYTQAQEQFKNNPDVQKQVANANISDAQRAAGPKAIGPGGILLY